MIAGQVGFAGSSIIGNNVSIGGQAGISGHLKIEIMLKLVEEAEKLITLKTIKLLWDILQSQLKHF